MRLPCIIIKNCTNFINITGGRCTGGIIGTGGGIITNCKNYGKIKGEFDVKEISSSFHGRISGGIAGMFYGNIYFSINYGEIKGAETTLHGATTGGIVGNFTPIGELGEIRNCQNKGIIKAGKKTTEGVGNFWNGVETGGIAGYVTGETFKGAEVCNIINCSNEGEIMSDDIPLNFMGGIVASTGQKGNLYNCYNNGTLIASSKQQSYVGGIAGIGVGGTISSCYNYALVNAQNSTYGSVGGLVGINEAVVSETNNYFRQEPDGINKGLNAIGKTSSNQNKFKPLSTAAFAQASSFDGWNIGQASSPWYYSPSDKSKPSLKALSPDSITLKLYPVGMNNEGLIEFGIELPKDEFPTGQLMIVLPAGITLNVDKTKLSPELAGTLVLQITSLGNNSWLIEIKPQTLKSSKGNSVYTKILDIAYNVDPELGMGKYEMNLQDVDLKLSDETHIAKESITATIDVNRYGTGINVPAFSDIKIYIASQTLFIDSPHSETIEIYSVSGIKLYLGTKPVGSFSISNLPSGVLIVKGSSGWAKKIVSSSRSL